MDILYLLVPLSVVLVLLIIGLFAWALHSGQFDSLEHQGQSVLRPETELSPPSKLPDSSLGD